MGTSDLPQNSNPSTNQIGMMDGNGTTITEQNAQQSNISSSLVDFLNHFRLFAFRFEAFCFNHWIWLIVIYICAIITFALMFDVRAAQLYPRYEAFYYTKRLLTIWQNTTLIVAVILELFAFTAWRRLIPSTFQVLLSKGRIYSHTQVSDITQEYRSFLGAYQSDLLSNKRYFVIAIPVIAIIVFQIKIWYDPSLGDTLLSLDNWFLEMMFIFTFLSLGYFFGVAVWVMGVTGIYIKKLCTKFDLTILPSHPDNCGGLRPLGNFCLGMAIPILIGAVFLGIWGIGDSLREGIHTNNLTADFFLFFIALPLAAIAFFVPLWNIHTKMRASRDLYYDNFADRVTKLENKIQTALDNGKIDEAKGARDEMEIVQVLNPSKIGYPTWPFDRNILIAFLAPQIIPIVSLIVQIIPVLMK